METKQYTRQYRYIDPDRAVAEDNGALLKNGKIKFNWDETEIKDATDKETGYTVPGEYIISCKASNATKALEVAEVELPTEVFEADNAFQSMGDGERLGLVRYALENKAKDETSAGLMERHESPEKAQKRLEKKQAKAAGLLKDWMMAEVEAGRYPSQDAFNDKVREIHLAHDLPLPGQETDETDDEVEETD
jgi:hypothetical protein